MTQANRQRPLILVTGGAGYVGLNTCYKLLQSGYDVAIVDNFSTGSRTLLKRLIGLQEEDPSIKGRIVKQAELDITDSLALTDFFKETRPDLVIHLAAKIVVGRANDEREDYFNTNVGGTENVIRAMDEAGVKDIIFSSTAAVYGEGTPKNGKTFTEDDEVSLEAIIEAAKKQSKEESLRAGKPEKNPNGYNTYAETKIVDENNLRRWQNEGKKVGDIKKLIINRFFNLAGAGGPNQEFGYNVWPPTHLMASAIARAKGLLKKFKFTCRKDISSNISKDGSTVRDYIHVEDIADALVEETNHLLSNRDEGREVNEIVNLGSGDGQSTNSIVEMVQGQVAEFTSEEGEVRPGEAPILVADVRKAENLFGWRPKHTLQKMIKDLSIFFDSEPCKELWKEKGIEVVPIGIPRPGQSSAQKK